MARDHGSRHSPKGGNLICFPVYRVYYFIGGGKSIAKPDGAMAGFVPPRCSDYTKFRLLRLKAEKLNLRTQLDEENAFNENAS